MLDVPKAVVLLPAVLLKDLTHPGGRTTVLAHRVRVLLLGETVLWVHVVVVAEDGWPAEIQLGLRNLATDRLLAVHASHVVAGHPRGERRAARLLGMQEDQLCGLR